MIGAQLAGLVLLIILATTNRASLALSASYPWKATALFAVIAAIVIARVGQHHPFPRFGPANQTTTLRAVIVALVVALVGEPATSLVATAAVVYTLVGLALDGVDGWAARRSRLASDFGARFDMEIDALLILGLATLTWRHGKAGVWVLGSGLIRYGFVAAGWLLPWLASSLPPRLRRQVVCVVQIAGLTLALVPAIAQPWSSALAALSLLALLYSFFVDVLWLARARRRLTTND